MKLPSFIFGVLFCFSLINCKQNEIVSNEMLNQLSTIENKQNNHISEFLYYTLFVKVNNDSYYITNGQELYDIYIENYKEEYSSYNEFLYDILNQKITLKEDVVRVNKTFILRQSLMDKNMEDILKDYSISNVKNIYRLNANIKDRDELNSLLYYFFKKRFYISFDDYSGVFILTPS